LSPVNKNIQNTWTHKPKPTGPISLVRTAHMNVVTTLYNCGIQYSTEQCQ